MKKRLDQFVLDLGLAPTRAKAQGLILAGEILVNGKPLTKAGHSIDTESEVRLANLGPKYVSRGGLKLDGALKSFGIDPNGWRCLDVGASTGGFTDCLLQKGAEHVTTVDVGKGQLDPKIRNHPRVTPFESLHVKDLTSDIIPKPVDLAVVDVAFISLTKVLPHVIPFIRPGGILLALIKPQFEATQKDLKKGVLKDEKKRQEILDAMKIFISNDLGLRNPEIEDAVIKGPKGNQEAFIRAQVL